MCSPPASIFPSKLSIWKFNNKYLKIIEFSLENYSNISKRANYRYVVLYCPESNAQIEFPYNLI
jgi:hypothetical protein